MNNQEYNNAEKIILYDSPEACVSGTITWADGTTTQIWRSSKGNRQFIHTDERTARWSGCTHKRCPITGEIFEKSRSHGPTEWARISRERYQNMAQRGIGCELFWGDKFYSDPGELIDDISENHGDEFTMLTDVVWAEARTLNHIDESDLTNDTHPDVTDVSDTVLAALKALNDAIEDDGPQWYEASQARPTDQQLSEWTAEIVRSIGHLASDIEGPKGTEKRNLPEFSDGANE